GGSAAALPTKTNPASDDHVQAHCPSRFDKGCRGTRCVGSAGRNATTEEADWRSRRMVTSLSCRIMPIQAKGSRWESTKIRFSERSGAEMSKFCNSREYLIF